MISIIAAVARNGVIGQNGRIPWNLPEDRAHFRQVTTGGAVIMGRRTFAEIGRPLPDRFHIIVSRTLHLQDEALCTAANLTEAIRIAQAVRREIFLCGGSQIYAEGMAMADRLYLTQLDDEYEGDVYFPVISPEFHLTERKRAASGRMWFSLYER